MAGSPDWIATGDTPLLPSPVSRDWKGVPGRNVQMASLPREVSLLPTPRVAAAGEQPGSWLERNGKLARERPKGASGIPLETQVLMLGEAGQQEWGRFSSAVSRWEAILGRPAPAATELSRNGKPRLAPAFSEWLMGLPHGWVTDVPGLSREDQFRVIGNGVVPQQGALALRELLRRVPGHVMAALLE